jgi:hypothetical protein
VLAPNAPLRAQVIALAGPLSAPRPAAPPAQQPERSPARYLWAALLARIYEMLPLRCVLCGGEMRIIAFVIEQPAQPHWDDTPFVDAMPPQRLWTQGLPAFRTWGALAMLARAGRGILVALGIS